MTEQVLGSCNTHFQMRILRDQILRQARLFSPKVLACSYPNPWLQFLNTVKGRNFQVSCITLVFSFPSTPVSSKQLKSENKRICHAPSSFCSGLYKITMKWGWAPSSTRGTPRTGQGHLQQGLVSNCSSSESHRAPPSYHLLHVLFFSSQHVHIFSSNTLIITEREIFISVDIICLLQVFFPQWHLLIFN